MRSLAVALALIAVARPNITPEQFADHHAARTAVPLFTADNAGITLDDAYRFQERAIAALARGNGNIAGYKTGFTGDVKPFGATSAVVGALLDSMVFRAKPDGHIFPAGYFRAPLVECELCYKFSKDIPPHATLDEIKQAVDSVAPAIELPDVLFANMKAVTWLDITAANVGARAVLLGKMRRFNGFDVNTTNVLLSYGDSVAARGNGRAVMGDQWQSLVFVVRHLANRGQAIRRGDVLISGTMTPILPGKKGAYHADFGEVGEISFEIR